MMGLGIQASGIRSQVFLTQSRRDAKKRKERLLGDLLHSFLQRMSS
jgi:hypothetical protein